jgi:acetoin utilization protein AcuC
MTDPRAFIYSSRFSQFSYGVEHPFKVLRYRLAFELIEEYGLLSNPATRVIECPLIDEEALLCFHRPDYLAALKEYSEDANPRANFIYSLGDADNPVFPGVYEWSRLVCGGTLEAARQVVEQGCRVAFNMAGGWHHAHSARASGFSYLNDAVIAIHHLLRRGLRVAYVDIDAHHGDGVQEAFYADPRVLTVSLHETGDDFFPHTGYPGEMGSAAGLGYAVNIPFQRHADDRLFRRAFERIVDPVLKSFAPDVLMTQMGVDTLRSDPLARLEFTTDSIEYATRFFLDTDLPWIVLGGGGYDKFNVARGWALVWGLIQGVELPDGLPPRFMETIASLGFSRRRLRDQIHKALDDDFSRAEQALERAFDLLEQNLLPLHAGV